MRSTDDYVGKIPPLYANKPNFTATIAATVAPFADLQIFFATLPEQFDIDVAVGVQLDAVGQWVGQSRKVSIPVAQPWFSWGVANRGWAQGYWKGPTILGNYISSLDDDTYRRLLYAKVAANNGAGTVGSAQAALDLYFINPATHVFVEDVSVAVSVIQPFSWGIAGCGWSQAYWRAPGKFLNQTQPTMQTVDMRWQIGVSGKIPSVVDLEILAQNLIPVTPAAVYRDVKVVTVDNTPLFGWGLSNEFIDGWGAGSWGADPDFVAQNIV
jgi:hypothetical protein